MKNIIIISLVAIVNFAMNFVVFVLSYNKLATPFLLEEQRMENADYIMTNTLFGFFVVTAVSALVLYLFIGKKCRASRSI